MLRTLVTFFAIIVYISCVTNAFQVSTPLAISSARTSSNLHMIFGPQKDDGKPGDYLCKDCGYVFTKGPEAWAKVPDKGACPPCGAPKFRFKKIPKGSADGKVEVKKSWFGN
mmetsp:Transcript_22067/g.44101  ORF Transcript_22067/g.44101 Transcript_22067/m.44101 type:complete len:112 (-) Transcript_22067:302-637(-)